jgi:hypothetical protein
VPVFAVASLALESAGRVPKLKAGVPVTSQAVVRVPDTFKSVLEVAAEAPMDTEVKASTTAKRIE